MAKEKKCGLVDFDTKSIRIRRRGRRKKARQSTIDNLFKQAMLAAIQSGRDEYFNGQLCKGKCSNLRIVFDLNVSFKPLFRMVRRKKKIRFGTNLDFLLVTSFFCLGRGETLDIGEGLDFTETIDPEDGGIIRTSPACKQLCPPLTGSVKIQEEDLDLEEEDLKDDLSVDLREKIVDEIQTNLSLRKKECTCKAPCSRTIAVLRLGEPKIELKQKANGVGFYEASQGFTIEILCLKEKLTVFPEIRPVLQLKDRPEFKLKDKTNKLIKENKKLKKQLKKLKKLKPQ